MSKLIVVANRLPVQAEKTDGQIDFRHSPGGLATGLSSLPDTYEHLWIGWPGVPRDELDADDQKDITDKLKKMGSHPVFLSCQDMEDYYRGFCNETIWPLFHYFPLRTIFEERFWRRYKDVNKRFCDEVVRFVKPGDYVWVHDYQLMLLPQMVRERIPDAQICYFLHIPFPSFELFRLLPWREELLEGLLGSDLIGFHTYDYVRHFLSSVTRITALEHSLGKLTVGNRVVNVDAFPMGINYEKYAGASETEEVKQAVAEIRQKVGDSKVIVSIDRLDYTKGIIERLDAFNQFLTENPDYRGKVTMIIVAVPSRTGVPDYMDLRNDLDQLVGRVNGEHGTIGWMPVWYLYRGIRLQKLVALYDIADMALVTPLRDGMNLIAKEFIASKIDGKGVLILSEMAGAASELGEAIIVNPYNSQEIVDAIKAGLEMPVEEQIDRNRIMQKRLSRYDVARWAADVLKGLLEITKVQKEFTVHALDSRVRRKMVSRFAEATRPLLMLDFEGTLAKFHKRPERAGPDAQIRRILTNLADDARAEVVVMGGRDRHTMEKWFGNMNLSLVAEHGAWIKELGGRWECVEPLHSEWKGTIRPIMQLYTDRTPGSSIEEKDFSLVWHFGRAVPELIDTRIQELRDALLNLTTNMDVGVFEGSRTLEVKDLGINKGRVAEKWLTKDKWDFILAVGNDYTDEDMFSVLPKKGYSIIVGTEISKARYNIESIKQVRALLNEMAEVEHAKS